MSDLPHGWARTRLGALGRYVNGRGFKSSEWSDSGRPIIRIQNLTGSSSTINYYDGEIEQRYIVEPGDLLISWAATLGAYFWPGPQAVLNQHIFRVESYINKKFHKYLVDHVLHELMSKTHGSGMVHITRKPFDETPVLLPPLAEQDRIVAAIEEQFSRLDASVAALGRARQNIKMMRLSLLSTACSGHLTAAWRDSNQSAATGTDLLTHLASQRVTAVRGKAKEAAIPDSALIPNLPNKWTHATVDQVCSLVTDGEHLTPPRTQSGVMLLSARNVQNGYLDYQVVDYISEDTYHLLARRLEVQDGDVLLSCSGSVGRSTVVPYGARFALVRSVAVLRPLRRMGSFISLMLRSPQLQAQIYTRKTETAQANIFQGQIRALTIPLPPEDEQAVIVDELERQLSLLDDLEGALNREESRFAALRSSILRAAFSGNLVPQDPADEPASALIDRIAAARASSNGHRPTRGRKPQALQEEVTA